MDKLFKGFVKTKNKKCLQKFGNGEELFTYDEIKDFPEFAGVLKENVILIDIDDFEQSEILMNIIEYFQINCRVFETTRGKHFYFYNTNVNTCKTHVKLACGLTADIKAGVKNSYSIVKFNNEERFCIWDENGGEIDTLPAFLLPIKSNEKIDFLTLSDGDGRNQTLFNYIITLQKHGLSKEDVKFTISLINKFILKKSLSESELNTILRDEAFIEINEENFFDSKGTFRFDEFAKFLVNKYKIIKINNQLHIFKDGVYKYGFFDIQAKMIKHIPSLNKMKRNEVLSYIDLLIDEETKTISSEWIAFNNGIYNIYTNEFKDFEPDVILTNKINYNFVKEAYSEIADKTLNKLACHDEKIRMLLEEVIGYTFFTKNELRKSFVLIGGRRGGKSTYLDMICTLLDENNISTLDLKDIGDRFRTAEIYGKLANIGDDIGDEYISNPAIFKKVVSGDRITVERKGQDPFSFSPNCKFLFSANDIPRIKDKSGAVLDRLIIVPFEAEFSKEDADFDPFIKYKLRESDVMEYLIQIGIAGLKRVLENQTFTIANKVKDSIKEYEENNNPILLFLKEIEEIEVVDKPTKVVYQKYCEFCISNNFQELSNIEFSKQIKRFFNVEIKVSTINRKSVRCFKKISG